MTEQDECLKGMPKKIKLGAYDWVVSLEDSEEELCGQADFSSQRIRIWPRYLTGPDHVVGVLFHECLHVVFENHGLGRLKGNREDREEATILGFETGLISLFRDNPKLMTWMRKHLR